MWFFYAFEMYRHFSMHSCSISSVFEFFWLNSSNILLFIFNDQFVDILDISNFLKDLLYNYELQPSVTSKKKKNSFRVVLSLKNIFDPFSSWSTNIHSSSQQFNWNRFFYKIVIVSLWIATNNKYLTLSERPDCIYYVHANYLFTFDDKMWRMNAVAMIFFFFLWKFHIRIVTICNCIENNEFNRLK